MVLAGNLKLTEKKTHGHAFNAVYINNIPYWLDITWISCKAHDSPSFKLETVPDFLVSDSNFFKTHHKYLNQKEGNAKFLGTSEDFSSEKKLNSIEKLRKLQRQYKSGEREITIPNGLDPHSPVVAEMIRVLQGDIIHRDTYGGALSKEGREDVMSDIKSRIGILQNAERRLDRQKGGQRCEN